jgi:hypothetical protein
MVLNTISRGWPRFLALDGTPLSDNVREENPSLISLEEAVYIN